MKHHLQPTHISQFLPAWLEHERVHSDDLQVFATAFAALENGLCVAHFFENTFPNTFFYTKKEDKAIMNNRGFVQAKIQDIEAKFELQVIEYEIDMPIKDLLNSLQDCHFVKAKKAVHYKGVLLATPTTWYYLPKLKLFDLTVFLPKNGNELLQLEIPYTAIFLEDYKQFVVQNEDIDTRFAPLAKLLSPRNLLQDETADYWEKWAVEMNYVIGYQQDKNSSNFNNSLLSQVEFALEQESHLREYREFTRFYGDNKREQQRGAAYYLTTIWLGRILFAKLIETRLIRYHASDSDRDRFRFLTAENFPDFKTLTAFFLHIFQTTPNKRTADFKTFAAIPYLNSSIFDLTLLEEKTIFATILDNKKRLPLYYSSVLNSEESAEKDEKQAALPVLTYLLRLLEKVDFGTNTVNAHLHTSPETLQLPLHTLYSIWEYGAATTGNLPYFIQSIPFSPGYDTKETSFEKGEKITFLHTGGGRMLGKALADILQNTPIIHPKTQELYDIDIHFANDGIQPILPNGQAIDYVVRFERRLRKLPIDLQPIQEAVFYTLVDIFNHKIQIFNELPHLNWATQWRLQAELLQFCFYKQGNNTQLEPFPALAIAEETGGILYKRQLTSDEIEQLARKEQRLQKIRRELYEKFPQLTLVPIDYSPEVADEYQILTTEITQLETAIAGAEIPKTAILLNLPDTAIFALAPCKCIDFQNSENFLQTRYHTANNAPAMLYIENLLYQPIKNTIFIAVAKDDLRTTAWKKLQSIAAQQHKTLVQVDERSTMKLLQILPISG